MVIKSIIKWEKGYEIEGVCIDMEGEGEGKWVYGGGRVKISENMVKLMDCSFCCYLSVVSLGSRGSELEIEKMVVEGWICSWL